MNARHTERYTMQRQKTPTLNPPSRKDLTSFRCINCRQIVPVAWILSGVHNRNHCPYCLHSRHLDLMCAGDRLAACKGNMQPVGITYKRIRNKYGQPVGELMLVHRCEECGKLSLNRIAADDDGASILALLSEPTLPELKANGIELLTISDQALVRLQLFGRN